MRFSRPMTMRRLLALPVRFYRLAISPMMAPRCRFLPTCSEYAIVALERHGALRGGWLALKRIGRCHRWNPGGIDEVPEVSGRPARLTCGCCARTDRRSILLDE